jgi:hypothetical protein
VLAIKVSAAVASLVVTAPYAAAYGSSTVSSWLFNSAIAGTQELAFQGTTLLARKLDNKDTITPDEVLTAIKEVGVSAATGAAATVVGRALAGRLATSYATRVLGRPPLPDELNFVAKRIEQIVVANFSEWSKDFVGLNKQPTWDNYQRVIGPLLDSYGVASELTKEKDLNKTLYPQ